MAFKVGDKVEHRSFGVGEIAFGPFLRSGSDDFYLMEQASDGEHRMAEGDAMTPVSKFKVGDKVRSFGDAYTVLAGPFRGYTEWYVVEDEDGKALSSNADEMTAVEPAEPALKVGDRVKVVAGRGIGHYVGQVVTLTEVDSASSYGPFGFNGRLGFTLYAEEVERVAETSADTHEFNGVTYDLSARYRDRDGDVWQFARFDGEVIAAIGRKPEDKYDGDSFSVAAGYGPLTRV